jgi:hypothetical protein
MVGGYPRISPLALVLQPGGNALWVISSNPKSAVEQELEACRWAAANALKLLKKLATETDLRFQ